MTKESADKLAKYENKNIPEHFRPLSHSLYNKKSVEYIRIEKINFVAVVKKVKRDGKRINLKLGSTKDPNQIDMTIFCHTQIKPTKIPKENDLVVVIEATLRVNIDYTNQI